MSGNNVLITDEDVQIRDGQHVLASYGSEDIYLGDRNDKNIHIHSTNEAGVDINDANTTIAHFGEYIAIGDKDGVLIDIDGVDILRYDEELEQPKSVALFGESVRIGEIDSGHTNIGSGGMTVYDYDKNNETQIELANIGYGSGNGYESMDDDGTIITTATAPYYTFGVRGSGTTGNYSVAEGYGNVAAGYASHAEGKNNRARAAYSHAGGIGNITNYAGQTVIGKYAVAPTSDDLFVVGKGYSDSNRENAMRLKFNGRVEFAGAVGTGLYFDRRRDMELIMPSLADNKPYNFWAGQTWTTTALGNEGGTYSFGIISKASSDLWQLLFMSGQNAYKGTFTLSTLRFNLQKLYTLNDIKDTYFTISNDGSTVTPKAELATLLSDYAKTDDIPSITGYVTTEYLENNYKKTGQDSTYAKFNDVYTISDVQRLFVPVDVNDGGESLKYVLNSNCARFKNAVDAILKGYGLIT